MARTLIPLALVVALAGCEEATDPATLVTEPTTVDEVLVDNEPDHYDVEACVWDGVGGYQLTLDGDATTSDGAFTLDDDTVTLTEGGTWVVTGSLYGRQLVVDTEDEIQLVLDGVALESSSGPALRVEDTEAITLLLANGSINTLVDGLSHPEEQEAPSAALSSRSDLTICGTGQLEVEGRYRDAVASSDGLVVAEGTLIAEAVDDGIRGKDYLVVRGGRIELTAGGDGLVSDDEEEADRGYILIEDGAIDLIAGGDGLSASTELLMTGGTVEVTAGGGAGSYVGETSVKGLKAITTLNIEGGELIVDAADDALHSDGALVFAGGIATLATGDDGVRGATSVHVTGGELNIEECYEGLESQVVTISGGVTHIVASDDGISVSDGTGVAGQQTGPPGNEELCDCFLSIEGGRLVVDANGDGLDSNGYGEMSGGVVIVNGPESKTPPDAALDFGELDILGGVLVSVHMDEMDDEMEGNSTQRYIEVSLGSTQSAGTLVHLEDDAGNDLLTFAPAKDYRALAFSSPDLGTGTHRLYVGGSATGTVEDGLYEDAVYTPGTLEEEFTISGIATSVGESSSFPGGPGRP